MMLVYLIPVLLVSVTDPRLAISGLVSLTAFRVIVGETLAWLVASPRRVHVYAGSRPTSACASAAASRAGRRWRSSAA